MKKIKRTMWNLPRDLTEEVLSRVPLTSLRKVRSTCKKWNTLSKDSFFAKKHLGQEAKVAEEAKELMVVMMDYSVYLMGFNLNLDAESCIKRQGKLIFPGSDKFEVSKVFHCDGLLLCVSKDHTRLVVWNPYCGKPLWIELTSKLNIWPHSSYALGYDKSSNSHKVVRFRDYSMTGVSIDFTIHDLNSDSWRVLDITPDWKVTFFHAGVSLNGNAYWLATKAGESDEFEDGCLVCFDFTRETFGPRLPLPFEHVLEDAVSLSVVRGGEKLAVLFQPWDTLKVEIWVTSKIEPDAVTWESKVFLEASLKQFIHPMFQFLVRGASFFIDEEKKVAMVMDKEFDRAVQPTRHQAYIIGVDGSLKKVDLGEAANKRNVPLACSYLPSLIQPN
ncbi:unnamed protein product [Microthlaspi erraticum]|uniref:F-box domain-containing protein n=1 Tax=Microthlaspi erraticum TaxID=1685480 RepID=A0A6D2HFN5_9BRAS|nr:unnamed protein product [Microthlaspi erraticum]